MRTALYLLGVALAILGAAVSWLCRNSLFTFEPTPLLLPVVITPGWSAQAPFTIHRDGLYEIRFDCQNPDDLRPPDHAAWDASVKSAVLRWEVLAGQRRIARSEPYPENWYGGGGRTGHQIGEFNADAGTPYTLRLTVESGDPRVNAHQPRVTIQLNGRELTDLSHVDEVRELVHRQARWAIGVGLVLVAVAVVLQVAAKRGAA